MIALTHVHVPGRKIRRLCSTLGATLYKLRNFEGENVIYRALDDNTEVLIFGLDNINKDFKGAVVVYKDGKEVSKKEFEGTEEDAVKALEEVVNPSAPKKEEKKAEPAPKKEEKKAEPAPKKEEKKAEPAPEAPKAE